MLRRSAIGTMVEWCECLLGAGVAFYRLGMGWVFGPVRGDLRVTAASSSRGLGGPGVFEKVPGCSTVAMAS